ncbi:hypothetical protein GGX14DRAFT_395521 [Mycena pura]|uniref:Uncharacterized protein n=1 Tax=Mycena pura TaxID=153505 RepID=A0AAD6YAS6_9AGAR|nr:hypothetical protein GGX14DRAFT_395521 [Mycena pura]
MSSSTADFEMGGYHDLLTNPMLRSYGQLRHKEVRLESAVYDELQRLAQNFSLHITERPVIAPAIDPRPAISGINVNENMSGCSLCAYTAGHKNVQSHITKKSPACASDASQISPWLLRTRWHEKIKVADMPELFQFAAFPSGRRDEDLDWLYEEVVGYFQKATKLMLATAELMLQQLNSADPGKDGLNNTPLTEHQKGDITLQNYAREITSFLASLLRTSGAFSYPTTASLTAALAKMRDDGLHSVFRALWMTTWLFSAECHMPDPTMCFPMLRSIKQTGEFNGPSDTTQPIVRLSWGIKLVCLTELHDMVQRGESESQMEAINTVVKWGHREHWSELMFKGNIVHLNQLMTIFGKLEAKLTDMWENKVLMGLGLHVEYGQLAEDLGNTELGYCFLDDPRNPFRDQEHRLLHAIYNSPKLRAWFFTQDGLNGGACRQWCLGSQLTLIICNPQKELSNRGQRRAQRAMTAVTSSYPGTRNDDLRRVQCQLCELISSQPLRPDPAQMPPPRLSRKTRFACSKLMTYSSGSYMQQQLCLVFVLDIGTGCGTGCGNSLYFVLLSLLHEHDFEITVVHATSWLQAYSTYGQGP